MGRGSTFHVRLPIATGAALDGGQGRAPAEAS
jgi:hypothetical protein